MIDSFFTIKECSHAEVKITKSKFISQVFPVSSVSEFNQTLKDTKKKYFDAAHHPFAYRAGIDKNNFKVSDDGEPSGCAGKPILDAIDKYGLTDAGLIVTRYFGGTKLGVGGLRRAFFEAADLCLINSKIVEKFITESVGFEFDYKLMNVVMRYIENRKLKLIENNSDEICKLAVDVRLGLVKEVKRELIEITNGRIKFKDSK